MKFKYIKEINQKNQKKIIKFLKNENFPNLYFHFF